MTSPNFLTTSHLTIGWFADQNELGRLVLRPPFQRRPVWTPQEMSFLVDTVLRSYPVPELYVYSGYGKTETGADIYAIVDGQQRLRACLDFMADGYPINFDVHKLEPLYSLGDTPWFGKHFSELTDAERDRFRRYKLIVRDLEGVTDSELRHMFHRLNQSNVALNAQELRYSMYQGGLLGTAEKLVKRDEWEQFRLFTKMQQRRMLDSEFIAELVIGYLHWPQNKKENLDHYYRQYSASFPFEADVLESFGRVLEYLTEVFPKPRMNGTRWYRKSDFYTLFLALARGQVPTATTDPAWLREVLTLFSAEIGGSAVTLSKPVAAYRSAVERAATDRARRQRREEALVAYVREKSTRLPDGERADLERALEAPLDSDVDDEDDADDEYADD